MKKKFKNLLQYLGDEPLYILVDGNYITAKRCANCGLLYKMPSKPTKSTFGLFCSDKCKRDARNGDSHASK